MSKFLFETDKGYTVLYPLRPHNVAFAYATDKEYQKAAGQHIVSMLSCLFIILVIGLSYKFVSAAYGWPWWMFPITMAAWYGFTCVTVYFSINPRPKYDPSVHGNIINPAKEDLEDEDEPQFDDQEW